MELERCGLEVVPDIKVPEELKKVVKDFMKSKKVFLVLYGAPGTYKTTTTKKLVFSLQKKKKEVCPYTAYYTKFYSLVDTLETDEELLEILKRTKLLVIDDLIFANLREHFWIKFFAIVDERYEKGRKTIFTTNHNPRDYLTGSVSIYQRIASRLCDENIGMLHETKTSFRNAGGGYLW